MPQRWGHCRWTCDDWNSPLVWTQRVFDIVVFNNIVVVLVVVVVFVVAVVVVLVLVVIFCCRILCFITCSARFWSPLRPCPLVLKKICEAPNVNGHASPLKQIVVASRSSKEPHGNNL